MRRTLLAQCAALAFLSAGLVSPVKAQLLTRPSLPWRTLQTEHFDFHYPAEMEVWTRDVAERMEGVHATVQAAVGWVPQRRVTVMVEDPLNAANGFAIPFLGAPLIFLWPTPPAPEAGTAHLRDWGELLAIHEFAHLAHLTRPSRNPRQARLWRLLPVNLGPVARRSPRWVTEGYATYIEGLLTGSGRPASAGRAAVLRQWALEGQLPTYGQLDGSQRFLGGAMAYLTGSAYLEWLVGQRGEESLQHLWRRMSARADRGFNAAFTGVYGAPPPELYGRFTVDITRRALALSDSLRALPGGLVDGSLVQRRTWSTGAPAISPNGELMALSLRSARQPARLVIWRTEPEPEPPAVAAARARTRERDPEDVPAVPGYPPPRRALSTLHAVAGRAYDMPRFMPGGERVLVVRSTPVGDGSERPDLYLWNHRDGSVRRVTRNAAVREADPFPDGTRAAGVRCAGGVCDVVEVTLRSGALRLLASGSPRRTFSRPRVSPDGSAIVVAMHERDRWRLVRIPAEGGEPLAIDPDDGASRYGADFLADGTTLVTTSERGGIAHLERIELATGRALALTRTTGAHTSSAVRRSTGDVFFLALHARGHDVRRVHANSVIAEQPITFGDALFPGVPPATRSSADTIPRAPLPPATAYGFGPRVHRVLPGLSASIEGFSGTLVVNGIDPVGRFSWLVQGRAGDPGTWQGATVAAQLRHVVPHLRAELFALRHHPSRQRSGDLAESRFGSALDADYAGGTVSATITRDYVAHWWHARAGAAAGSLELNATLGEAERATRLLGSATLEGGMRRQQGRRWIAPAVALHGATGRTGDADWTRTLAVASLAAGAGGRNIRGSGMFGMVDRDAPVFEQFVLGGVRPPFADGSILAQRVSMPALPLGVAGGRRVATARVETTALGATLYYWTGTAGERLDDWQRVVGLERELAIAPIPFVALPSVRLLAGAGYSLDEPVRRRVRFHASVTYSP